MPYSDNSPTGARCTDCGKPLISDPRSVRCWKCFSAKRLDAQRAVDEMIAAGLAAGKPHKAIAADIGCKINRVRKGAERMKVTVIPTSRIRDIIAAAARCAGITQEQLTGSCRSPDLVKARQAVALIAMQAGNGAPAVAGRLGAHRSSVLHNRDVAEAHAQRSERYAAYLDRVRTMAQAGIAQATPARLVMARNDFAARVADDEDEGHRFHSAIAAGSWMLQTAILAARPHGYR